MLRTLIEQHPPNLPKNSQQKDTNGLNAAAAVADGKPALVNVVTDWKARATTTPFTLYST